MKTFLTVALGVFTGLLLFAGVAYWIYSGEVRQAKADELARLDLEIQQREKMIQYTDSLAKEMESLIPDTRWLQVDYVDPITDRKSVRIGVPANSDNPDFAPSLVIACEQNSTKMLVNWNTFIESHLMTTTRLDDTVYKKAGWERSSDYTTSFYPGNPITLIKKMLVSERYVVRGENMSGQIFTAVFELEGINEAIQPVRQHCSW